jgi:hypothetical protein
MSHTEYSAQFVQYSSVFLGLEEALAHGLASPPLQLAVVYDFDQNLFTSLHLLPKMGVTHLLNSHPKPHETIGLWRNTSTSGIGDLW